MNAPSGDGPVNPVSPVKRPFYRLVRYLLNTRYVREQLRRSGRDLFCQERPRHAAPLWSPAPYRGPAPAPAAAGNRPVFITARFRSGSTFLWLVFRNIPGVTAYYEPLNPNRWFSPTAPSKVDPSHKRVTDYGAEYRGMADLDRWFRDDWSSRFLHMDRTHYDPDLYRYVGELVRRAEGRAVLQFNRVDFRLDWLRANFREAQILHLYRDPREQWMSMQRTEGYRVPLECRLSLDLALPELPFYTLPWALDLRGVFPFLEPELAPHPYALHYYLWRLSYSYGRQYADHSVAYEALVEDFSGTFGAVAKALDLSGVDLEALAGLIQREKGVTWPEYAPAAWFDAIEAECERVLVAHFGERTHDAAGPARGA
jgi:Sulfotransferase family